MGTDIAAGRYFSDPNSGCYWERQKGSSGSLNDILANDFVSFNARQLIVDVQPSDYSFKSDPECGTWFNTPRHSAQATISGGTWLVNTQVQPGRYITQASSGCYWERLRDFSGTVSGIIANDFVSGAGQQIVQIASNDIGFHTDGDCGTWAPASGISIELSTGPMSRDAIESNRRLNRSY